MPSYRPTIEFMHVIDCVKIQHALLCEYFICGCYVRETSKAIIIKSNKTITRQIIKYLSKDFLLQ